MRSKRLIDKLLESPRYGERWAQHWLDLARYGESDGYRQDAYRPDAWRYRDYVIRSLNEDKPYDRFVREQLAGDEIDRDNPDALIATSLLRQTAYEYNERDAEGQRTTILNEITDSMGELFLGLSFACARCHDHKFDPILQKDYFRLQAFFAPMIWRDDLPLASAEEKRAYEEQLHVWEAAAEAPRKRLADALRPKLDKTDAGRGEEIPRGSAGDGQQAGGGKDRLRKTNLLLRLPPGHRGAGQALALENEGRGARPRPTRPACSCGCSTRSSPSRCPWRSS